MLAAGLAAASALLVIAGVSRAVFPLLALCVAAAILEGLPGAVERVRPYIKGRAWNAICDWLAAVFVRASGEPQAPAAPEASRLRRQLGIGAALAGLGLVLFLALFSLTVAASQYYTFGGGADETKLPQRAVAFVKASGLKGIILVHPRWAGYLAKEDFPGARPFRDARPLATEGTTATAVAWVFGMPVKSVSDVSTVLQASNASAILVPQKWARAVDFARAWVPVYWDDTAAVLVSDTPANKSFIAANDMRLTYPPYFGFGLTKDKLPEVISMLEQKVSAEERSAYARYELGICYFLKGQREPAAANLVIALGTDPTLAVAYHTLGDIVRLADKPELIGNIAQALSQDPGLTEMLSPVVAAKPKERTRSLAIALYSQAIRYDPDFAMAYVRLGDLLLQKGDVFRATSVLIDARKADDRRPQLDRFAPGLRSQLDEQIKRLTAPRPTQAGAGAASTDASLAAPEAQSTDSLLGPAR
jgi:tetratricopeptide (TPR) repeat protein